MNIIPEKQRRMVKILRKLKVTVSLLNRINVIKKRYIRNRIIINTPHTASPTLESKLKLLKVSNTAKNMNVTISTSNLSLFSFTGSMFLNFGIKYVLSKDK